MRDVNDRPALYYGLPCALDPSVEDDSVREVVIPSTSFEEDGRRGNRYLSQSR